MDDTTTIFKLTVEDILQVARDVLNRNLTQPEMTLITDHIDEYISWYDAAQKCIEALIKE